jgi:hypothetical protein
MQKFHGVDVSAVGPVRTSLKNLKGSNAFAAVIGHDAN